MSLDIRTLQPLRFPYLCSDCGTALPDDQSLWGGCHYPGGTEDDVPVEFFCARCWDLVRGLEAVRQRIQAVRALEEMEDPFADARYHRETRERAGEVVRP